MLIIKGEFYHQTLAYECERAKDMKNDMINLIKRYENNNSIQLPGGFNPESEIFWDTYGSLLGSVGLTQKDMSKIKCLLITNTGYGNCKGNWIIFAPSNGIHTKYAFYFEEIEEGRWKYMISDDIYDCHDKDHATRYLELAGELYQMVDIEIEI